MLFLSIKASDIDFDTAKIKLNAAIYLLSEETANDHFGQMQQHASQRLQELEKSTVKSVTMPNDENLAAFRSEVRIVKRLILSLLVSSCMNHERKKIQWPVCLFS